MYTIRLDALNLEDVVDEELVEAAVAAVADVADEDDVADVADLLGFVGTEGGVGPIGVDSVDVDDVLVVGFGFRQQDLSSNCQVIQVQPTMAPTVFAFSKVIMFTSDASSLNPILSAKVLFLV
jgi:hypothetical protein